MNCPTCDHENRQGAKFCENCAAPLKHACGSCGVELRPAAKFCDECGTATAASRSHGEPRASESQERRPADTAGARKVITIVFADLVGSTALHERIDPESARVFMEAYYRAMRAAVEGYGGTVTQLLGDGVKAVFGAPRVAEDDAVRAVRAAVAMQRSFRDLAEQHGRLVGKTGLRVAVNTGEVIASDESEIIGDPVNVAARLQEQGRDGDVVIGEATHRLVSHLITLTLLGSFTLKGRAEAVRAYRVVSLERPEGTAATAFVGREDELARIGRVYETAVAVPASRFAVLLGSPGLGKSRLIEEFGRRQHDAATVVFAHCESAGGATFAPLAEALREFLHIDSGATGEALRSTIDAGTPGADADRARVVDGITALVAGSPALPEETFFVVRRWLAVRAAVRPVVLVIDDLQWAEPLFLDLVEHLVQWGSGVPLLVLGGARPELRDTRSSLTTPGGLVAEVLTLAGLDAGAATRLAANVIGAADLPAAVAAKVLATSEGNPLFVGELVRMLVQEGALERQGDRWTTGAGLAEIEMPPTIHALLAARIERLRPEERSVLERASVVGRQFSRSAVAELLPRDVTDLDARLESLRRSELIERDTGWFLGEPGLRFHHVLIRDAAYRRVLKGTRAELHARFADWIEARAGASVEHDEMTGWHLEQAHRHLGELGPIDENGRALGERAARYLAAAGRRALVRDDVSLAASLLGRALDRLDNEDPQRADLALDWCEALLAAGDVGPAAAAIDELGRFSADSERLLAWHTCFAGQLTVFTSPQALHATADAVAAAAETLAALGDAAGEAKAHFVHAQALARLGKVGACEAALDRALAAARRAGDRRRANAVLAGAPLAALWGPSPVTRASGRCLDVVRVLRITQGAPAVEAVALSCQGVLEALRGRTDAARRMIASSRRMVEELGITHRLLEADVFAGRIDLLEGDAVAAERSLRGAYEGLRDLGLGIDAAQAAALLARSLLAQDRAAEAEMLSHESEALAGDDLKAAIAWRGVRAEALARRGEHAAAVELAEAAVAIASATDALLDHADARLALAAALHAAGRSGDANAEERCAHELWEAKGATLLAERAQRGSGCVTSSTLTPGPRVEPTAPSRRSGRPNDATTACDSLGAAFAAGDDVALEDVFSADLQVVDHPTGSSYGREGTIDGLKRLFRMTNPSLRHEPLATLGESLALYGRRISASGTAGGRFDVGEVEREDIVIHEADEHARVRCGEIFAADRLDAAIARLHERYAELLPEGAARTRAATTARAVAAILRQPDARVPAGLVDDRADAWAGALADDAEQIDNRQLGTWNARGADAVVAHIRSLREVADGVTLRTREILGLEPGALLLRRMHSGTERLGGGSYERPLIVLLAFAADGRVARVEFFDDDAEAAALVRFDEVTSHSMVARPVQRRRLRPNAASAVMARIEAAFRARDLGAIDAVLGETLETVDHPSGATYGRAGQLESSRRMMRLPDLDARIEVLATLGDVLVLGRRLVSASGTSGGTFDVGEYEMEHVVILVLDAAGRIGRSEVFSSDHLADALARFYELYADQRPEGPSRRRAAEIARTTAKFNFGLVDPDHLADPFAAAVEMVDHRRVGLGTLRGAESVLKAVRAFLELVQNAAWRIDDVLALTEDATLLRTTNTGTDRAGGGSFERVILSLQVYDDEGRCCRWETFESENDAEALARFEELRVAATKPVSRFANAASRALERTVGCFNTRDWEGVLATYAPTHRMDDRRKLPHLEVLGEDVFSTERFLYELPGSAWEVGLLATRGERFALCRAKCTAEGDGDDELSLMAVEVLDLIEVDADGRRAALVIFDSDDVESAYIELDARYHAGEGAGHGVVISAFLATTDAVNRRDWEALSACLASEFSLNDHRLLGWGTTLDDKSSFVRAQQALVELSPDARYRVDHLRASGGAHLCWFTQCGTREGGVFETQFLNVGAWDQAGRALGYDVYDVEQSEAAFARFEELGDARMRESLDGIPQDHPVVEAMQRWATAFDLACKTDDWGPLHATCAAGFVFEDRQRMAQVSGDRELMVASARERATAGARPERRVIATAGDRVALWRLLWSGGPAGGRFEIQYLTLAEVDETGLFTAIVIFDEDSAQAAQREAWARWSAIDAKASRWLAVLSKGIDAFNVADGEGLRDLLADDFAYRDERRISLGAYDADALVESLRAWANLAPDLHLEVVHCFAWNRHGAVPVARFFGTFPGGGPFEHVIVSVVVVADGRICVMEDFDLEDADRAVARFEDLCAAKTK